MIEKLNALRPLLEKELGGVAQTTRILNGLKDDLKLGKLYVISNLRAIAFVSKNEELKLAVGAVIKELL